MDRYPTKDGTVILRAIFYFDSEYDNLYILFRVSYIHRIRKHDQNLHGSVYHTYMRVTKFRQTEEERLVYL